MRSSSKKLIFAPALIFVAASMNTLAQSTLSHVHGNADLNVVLIERQLQIEFVSPAVNLLGFEHPPVTDEESTVLNDAITQLQQSGWLIGDISATCQISVETFEAPTFDEQGHGHDEEHEHDSEPDADAHSDFRVQYLYNCQTAPPTTLQILAFDHFRGIETLTVQWIADQRQGYAKLNRGSPVLILD